MTLTKVALTLRRDTGPVTDTEPVTAFALVCQDEEQEYLLMAGPKAALRDLYCWGLLNFGMASPLPELVQAVDRVLRPAIGIDATVTAVASPKEMPSSPRKGALRGPWTMDAVITVPDGRRITLAGMTDLVLMLLTADGERKVATGGSGMQKSKLLEMGIGKLFGDETLAAFLADYRGDEPEIMRRARAQALARTRKGVKGGDGVDVIAIVLPLDDET